MRLLPDSKERSVGTDEDRVSPKLPFELELDEIHERKKAGSLGRLGMDLPLTSPAIPAFVHPRRARAVAHLAVSVFAVRFAHTPRRGIRFRCLTPCSSFLVAFLFLSAPSSFVAFFPLLFFPRTTSSLSPWLSASGAFSPTRPWTPLPRLSKLVSLVCVCFLCIASRSSLRFPTL